ncbi:MAG: VIRB2 type IV secretion [Alphaproteobacteria bacterium HGW-Alphaproteobacteria-1]|nr:MAG: VIRB2 type IV secretion [Alphaproteobacteria bacterium HGW-Alphaproteobacteria-1]
MRGKKENGVKKYVLVAAALSLAASPAFAQAIDLSAVNSLLQSVLDALTGITGRLLLTIVAALVLLGGAFNFIDWSRVFQVLVIIVLIGVIPTVIQSIWGASGGGTP